MENTSCTAVFDAGRRRLPRYAPVVWKNEINDSLWSTTAERNSSQSQHEDELIEPKSRNSTIQLPAITKAAPPPPVLKTGRTFPSYNYDHLAALKRGQVSEPPNHTTSFQSALVHYTPAYDQDRSFRLQGSFVYGGRTSSIPRYQMAQDLNVSGKPSTLRMRKLRPRETRACSVPAIHAARKEVAMQYKEDETMYTMDAYEMRASEHLNSELEGSVQITSGRALWGGTWIKIWHVFKAHGYLRNSLNEERGTRKQSRPSHTHRTSYHENDKVLLYSVRKGVWEDGEGAMIAKEEAGGKGVRTLDMDEMWARDESRRDFVVACWVMKVWVTEGFQL